MATRNVRAAVPLLSLVLFFAFVTTSRSQSLWKVYADSADIAIGQLDFDKAIDYLTKAIDAHPNTAMLSNYDYSRDFLMSEDLADLHEARADLYSDQERYEEAGTDLTYALYFDDYAASRWYRRAVIWQILKMPDGVISDLDEAIARDSTVHEMWGLRGKALLEQKEYKRAMRDFTEAIALDSSVADYYEGRAAAWRGMGKEKKAKADEQIAATLRIGEEIKE